VEPVRAFGVQSKVIQGAVGMSAALGLTMLLASMRVARYTVRGGWDSDYNVCAYLVLTAACSFCSYVLFRCGVVTSAKMRYDMLSIAGAVGLSAWFLRVERIRVVTIAWTLLVLAWSLTMARPHAELVAEYLTHPPINGQRVMVRALEAHGISYAKASYEWAYPIDFLSGERIVVASSTRVRIREYQRKVAAQVSHAVVIGRDYCDGGTRAAPGMYLCPPVHRRRR
jgi:hypothetical protein